MKRLSLTGVPLDSVVTITILSESHGVSLPTMDIYSVPLLNAHVLVRINTLIMNHVQVDFQRKQGAILGLSLMYVVHKAWKNSQLEINRGIESCEAGYFRKLNRKAIPRMPCQANTETNIKTPHLTTHRPRSEHHPAYNAMVARLLTMKEVNSNPKAQQAILEEGEELLKQGVWDVNSVREKHDVIRDAMRLNKKVHFARIFPICSEKGSEIA